VEGVISLARPKTREFKPVNVNVAITVLDKLERYCEETGRTKTMAIERILDKYLTEYFSQNSIKSNGSMSIDE